MGAGANVNAFFGVATMIIAVPTGAKVFNWLFTMYRGSIRFSSPMLWTIGFMITFVIGGMTGVLMAVPGVDFQVHNSLFLVAHFHNAIIGGVVFGYLAGLTYWFPKALGFTLNEKLGKAAFWCWFIGFYVAFTPLYALGLMGMTRRLNHYPDNPGWHLLLVIAGIGVLIIAVGFTLQVLQLIISFKNRHKVGYKDETGDPWNGRTLEWSIPSPAPFYNFAVIPEVTTRDAFWEQKQQGKKTAEVDHIIHMPKNTGTGFVIGLCAGAFGFAMTWHMTAIIVVSLLGIMAAMVVRSFDMDTDYEVTHVTL